ncbi:hypothetical protein BgiBS90_018031, partial [Biomphalaria glabrata]
MPILLAWVETVEVGNLGVQGTCVYPEVNELKSHHDTGLLLYPPQGQKMYSCHN